MAFIVVAYILVCALLNDVDCEINARCECLTYTRTYSKEFGTFNSPDYPRPYAPATRCLLYTFMAAPNEIVEITFKDFNVYKASERCLEHDYVKVYAHVEDGRINEYTPWDNVLCGKYPDIPHVLYSSVPALVLQFHSGSKSTNSSGFIGTFRFLDKRIFETDGRKISGTRCDQQFESGNGSLQGRFYSPRYPASYPRSIRCFYRFKARPEERVKLVFEDLILQKGDDSCINREDVIKVHDGFNAAAPTISLLCNELVGAEVFSSGPNLFVEFIANDQWPGQGFKAGYYFQHANELQNINEIQQVDFGRNMRTHLHNTLAKSDPQSNKFTSGRPISYPLTRSSCDSYIRSSDNQNGSLTSPLYPRPYPSGTRCFYVFQAQGRERVQIVFDDLNLYYNNKEPRICAGSDTIIVYGKVEDRMEKLFTLCGRDRGEPIMSSGPTLIMEFVGLNSASNVIGFRASYQFVENFGINSGTQLSILPCAFQFNSSDLMMDRNRKAGKFASPNYPGSYPRNTECHYFFYGKESETVKIDFNFFDVEGVSPCDEHSESDYVEFSNYMAHDIGFARYCGNLSSFSVSSKRNFFRVSFRSNYVLDGRGFEASYQFINGSSTREILEQNYAHSQKPQDFFVLHAFILLLTQNVTNLNLISYVLKRLM